MESAGGGVLIGMGDTGGLIGLGADRDGLFGGEYMCGDNSGGGLKQGRCWPVGHGMRRVGALPSRGAVPLTLQFPPSRSPGRVRAGGAVSATVEMPAGAPVMESDWVQAAHTCGLRFFLEVA